jgi:hypothetical protein
MEQQASKSPSGVNKGLPVAALIALSKQGMSNAEIARVVGCSPVNIHQRFKALEYNPQYVKNFTQYEVEVLEWAKSLLISGLTPEKVKKMSPRDISISYGVFFDKQRLLMGQSTENVDLHASFEAMEETRSKRQILENLLAKKGIDIRKALADNTRVEHEEG